MTNDFDRRSEDELRALFGGLAPPVPDDGFSHRVIRQVQAALWKRRALIAAAAFAGLVLAAPAVTQLLVYVSAQLQLLVAVALGLLK